MKKTKRNIVIGQRVAPNKAKRAKELRHQMTEAETILWEQLSANQLDGFHFRRQQVIDGFIVDFYCHAAGLIIEVDGKIHQKQMEYDAERDKILKQRNLQILRVTNNQVKTDLNNVLQSIRKYLNQQSI